MAFSDSMFLFEIKVEELQSCIDSQRFRIRSQFGDVFTLHLKDPNIILPEGPSRTRKKKWKKETKTPVPSVQTCLITSHINTLALHMQKYPMYLCLWSKGNPYTLGSTYIPWSPCYLDYLESLKRNEYPSPAEVRGKYSIFNEYTSKKMAIITLSIKLTLMDSSSPVKFEPFTPQSIRPPHALYNDDPETNVSRYGAITPDDIGIIKTIYSGGKRTFNQKRKTNRVKKEIKDSEELEEYRKEFNTYEETKESDTKLNNKDQNFLNINDVMGLSDDTISDPDEDNMKVDYSFTKTQSNNNLEQKNDTEKDFPKAEEVSLGHRPNNRLAKLVRSNTEIDIKQNNMIRSKSCSSIEIKERLDILDYIFAENNGPFGNKVYCVNYFTVENDNTPGASGSPSKTPTPAQTGTPKSEPISAKSSKFIKKIHSVCPKEESERHGPGKFAFKICNDDCERQQEMDKCYENICSIDLPEDAGHMIAMRKCTAVITCPHKRDDGPPRKPDDQILLKLQSLKGECCKIEKVEEIVGGMQMNMKMDDPCYCACDCKFGVIRKTTYCAVCGGYEIPGEPEAGPPKTFPCPIFHKLERKKEGKKGDKEDKKAKKLTNKESVESEKEREKAKTKKKRDERFKFNYGYKGIPPQIGHSQCALPCTGTMGLVPKHMGWLWTAGNIPGLKFRPCWRPGAANKHVVRMLRDIRFPEQVLAKKRRKIKGEPKRPLKRPLLVVEKKDGEYTVTMETMKVFNKPRMPNTYPYEDKPLVTFKVGRTDEENAMRARLKARAQRNLEVEQRQFIQSTFHNLCKDICYKTYQQAMGMLPGDEDPTCPCLPLEPGPERVNLERTCSCSDQSKSSDVTASDDDEWVVEFTPPNAIYDPGFKGKRILKVNRETQYTYLDFRVKLTDRFGNPVPRFFIGPDGKKECSDLGGFWGPDKKWLEINYDGYVAPDGRWAPNNFIGPTGEMVDAEEGKFQDMKGKWYIVGIDGYVQNGKWCNYSRPKPMPDKMKKMQPKPTSTKKGTGDKKYGAHPGVINVKAQQSETTWSCFGDVVDPKALGKMGILGHGHDRQVLLTTLKQMMARGDSVVIPQPSKIPPGPKRKKKEGEELEELHDSRKYFSDRVKCHHRTPSDKGIHAVDEHGNKVYFRYRDPKNKRPKDRMIALQDKGVSLSSFHVPCLSSFIDSETARQQNIEHIKRHNAKFKPQWKPGCISKRLLRQLNRMKRETATVSATRPVRKTRKRVEDKPTLIVAKRSGQYIVEMQVTQADANGNIENYNPLIYKIASADNEEKVERRQRKEQRLINKAYKKIFRDPFHPEICQQTCMKAYKQAIGILPFDPENPECICPEDFEDEEESVESFESFEEESSDESSLDLDWEIQFSPPIMFHSEDD